MRLFLVAMVLVPALASAQDVVTSPRPDAVAVTVYRDPNRQPARQIERNWLGGYALVSETRTVRISAGSSEVLFEGVASGILPQSAILSGFGGAVIERNRDAYLLSPGTLLYRSLGERVHLRRTSKATGKVIEQDAIVRTSVDGGMVVETAGGIEALRCSGQSETLLYDRVPAGLSARPTLSVRLNSPAPVDAVVTLSYLASGFDWQANYVATLNAAGDRLDLFAWLTLASGDQTSFVAARTSAVAGKLNREYAYVPPAQSRALTLNCWPQGNTSQPRSNKRIFRSDFVPPAPPAPPPPAMLESAGSVIVVTGSKIAQREDLGDLKLYTIPEAVTVAAKSQKQVAMIEQRGVKVDIVYRARLYVGGEYDVAATRTLVTRNRKIEGLGLPLPAGGLVLFADRGGTPLVVGEGSVDDKAVGEDVEIPVGAAPGVRVRQREVDPKWREVTVTNDAATPIRFEAVIDSNGARLTTRTRLGRRDGDPLWAVTVPAHGSATLRYRKPA